MREWKILFDRIGKINLVLKNYTRDTVEYEKRKKIVRHVGREKKNKKIEKPKKGPTDETSDLK